MPEPRKKKLIEVGLPLEKINQAAEAETRIRSGHPKSIHQWWSRKPLSTTRGILFAQLPAYVPRLCDRQRAGQTRRVGVVGMLAAIGLVAAGLTVGGCRGEDAALRETVVWPEFDQPSDVPGEALSFEMVNTRSGSTAGGLDEPWVRVVLDDAELRDLWFDQEDRGGLGSPAVDEVPPIPDGATALWLCAGWESHGVARAVGGVYGADGEWVVTAYAVRYDTGDEIAPAVVWGHRAVLFVDAPPPKSVRIRGEEPTGGGLDGSVIWGGAPPEPSPALALPSVCQPAAGRHRPSPAGHLFGT